MDEVATIVAPGTLLTWHRNLIRRNHTGSACRTPGRPATRQEIAALAVRMAEENRSWGYRRIQGALSNLGHDLAHNTVRNILKRHGIEPSPERARRTTWTEFLQIHWQQIVASDFVSTDCSKKSRLASLIILCFMKLSTHRVDVARTKGATDGLPMIHIVRKVTPEMERLCNQKCDHIPKARSRTHCEYRRDSRVGKLENLILPPALNHASKINRHQRRDRLLNDSECEAA